MLIEKENVAELLPADYNPRKDLRPGDPEYESSSDMWNPSSGMPLLVAWLVASALKGSPGHGHDGS